MAGAGAKYPRDEAQLLMQTFGQLRSSHRKRPQRHASSCAGRIAPAAPHQSPRQTEAFSLVNRNENDNSRLGTMINAFLVFNGQGQPRLTKFYTQLVSLHRHLRENHPRKLAC